MEKVIDEKTEPRRKWTYFREENEKIGFAFRGYILYHKLIDSWGFYGTLFFTITVFTLFMIFTCPYLQTEVSVLVPISMSVLFTFTLLFMLSTTFSDPGILVRARKPEINYIDKNLMLKTPFFVPRSQRTFSVLINGVESKLKYCYTCKFFRPPRASHCSLCNACVENLDHHCPYLGTCIGRRNYRSFYLFISFATLLTLTAFSFCVLHITLVLRKEYEKYLVITDALLSLNIIMSSLVGFCSFGAGISCLCLCLYHSYIIVQGVTTRENIKDTSKDKNLFSRQSYIKNFCRMLCEPVAPFGNMDPTGIADWDFLEGI